MFSLDNVQRCIIKYYKETGLKLTEVHCPPSFLKELYLEVNGRSLPHYPSLSPTGKIESLTFMGVEFKPKSNYHTNPQNDILIILEGTMSFIFRNSSNGFFVPIEIYSKKFQGKDMAEIYEDFTKEFVDSESWQKGEPMQPEAKVKLCTCSSRDLFNFGCRCGGK